MQQTFTTATWLLTIIPLCSLIVFSAVNYIYYCKRQNKKQGA